MSLSDRYAFLVLYVSRHATIGEGERHVVSEEERKRTITGRNGVTRGLSSVPLSPQFLPPRSSLIHLLPRVVSGLFPFLSLTDPTRHEEMRGDDEGKRKVTGIQM